MDVLIEIHQEHKENEAIKRKHLSVENLYKALNVKGIENLENLDMGDCELSVSDLIAWSVSTVKNLDAENERMASALDYILESGAILERDAVEKARWGLGLEIENEQEIAALKPRFS